MKGLFMAKGELVPPHGHTTAISDQALQQNMTWLLSNGDVYTRASR